MEILARIKKINREIESHHADIMLLQIERERLYHELEPIKPRVPQWQKLDFPLTCKICNKPTRWRHPRGWAQHEEGKCHIPRLGTTPGISGELWAELDKILGDID